MAKQHVNFRIEGLREFTQALNRVSATHRREGEALVERLAHRVKDTAVGLMESQFVSGSRLSGALTGSMSVKGGKWSELRVGGPGVPYAPWWEFGGGGGGRPPRRKRVAKGRSLVPAVEQETPAIEREMNTYLQSIANRLER